MYHVWVLFSEIQWTWFLSIPVVTVTFALRCTRQTGRKTFRKYVFPIFERNFLRVSLFLPCVSLAWRGWRAEFEISQLATLFHTCLRPEKHREPNPSDLNESFMTLAGNCLCINFGFVMVALWVYIYIEWRVMARNEFRLSADLRNL